MLSGFGSTAGGFGLSFSEGFFGGGETGPGSLGGATNGAM